MGGNNRDHDIQTQTEKNEIIFDNAYYIRNNIHLKQYNNIFDKRSKFLDYSKKYCETEKNMKKNVEVYQNSHQNTLEKDLNYSNTCKIYKITDVIGYDDGSFLNIIEKKKNRRIDRKHEKLG